MTARVLCAVLLAGLLACTGAPADAVAQDGGEAAQALRTGDYDAAIRQFDRRAREPDATPDDFRSLVRALSAVGRYDEAEEVARRGVERHGVELRTSLGRMLFRRGKVDESIRSFTAAVEGGATDRLTARLGRAVADYRRGRRDEALRQFDAFIDIYNAGRATSAEDLIAVGTAVRYLGTSNPDLFQDALRAYDEAVAADGWNLEARVLTGELFLEKYDGGEAAASFRDVLEVNPNQPDALVGYARTLRFNGDPGVRATLEQALEVNPNHVEGRVFLATLHLAAEQHDDARSEAERALDIDPASLEALSVLAATHYLADDTARYERVKARTMALNPGYADLLNTVAERAVDQRRYADAVALARQAVALDPQSWRGLGILGINLLRLGEVAASREVLERAFAGDPYNVWFKNTLDLLDTYDRYVTVETEHFAFFLRQDEADLLSPYATALAEEAYGEMVLRYGVEPPTPVRLELYPSHADFSVRTAGLAGIGILGVSFGSVLAMDSPAAREVGGFNWGSVLWHELAHAFHLGMTDHRVPRWFSEGLAVREQRLARAGWGHQPDTGFLLAYDEGRLHPVSTLNEGFVRPAYPEQVVFSYYQASLVFEMIEEEHGFGAVLAMLDGYREGAETPELMERVLGLGPSELDARFDAYMSRRFGPAIEAVRPRDLGPEPSIASLRRHVEEDPGDFAAQLGLGRMLLAEGHAEAALRHLGAAEALFPESGAMRGPAWFMGRALEALGRDRDAADAYRRALLANESNYDAALARARLLEDLGEHRAAADALESAVLIYPYEIELHERLATLLVQEARWEAAVRERKAVLALDPSDRAEAHYQLAVALRGAGRPDRARSEVLRALEVAPTYEDALNLLLELRSSTRDTEGGP